MRDWLPGVIQASKPWMSEADIEKGSRGLSEIGKALEGIRAGIVCLTPENQTAPWILYEAGALSKSIGDKTRLCTYLLGGLQSQDVRAPLGMFQATKADKEETRKLVHSINRAISDNPVPDKTLNAVFDAMWSDIEKVLTTLPEPVQKIETRRSTEEMVSEILELVRADANRKKKTDQLDEFIPVLEQLLPHIRDAVRAAGIGGTSGFSGGSTFSSTLGRLGGTSGSSGKSEPNPINYIKLPDAT